MKNKRDERISFLGSKKGAEMTIGTIVMIILALVVLVVIIYGFTVGWSNLFQNIQGFGGGDINVQTIVQACQVACATNSQFDYCTRTRNVVFDDTDEDYNKNKWTCGQLADGEQEGKGADDGAAQAPIRTPVDVGLDCSSVTCS
jgi:hypothetical protein